MSELWEGFSLLAWGRASLLALGQASLSGVLVIALVAGVCRFVPRVPASVRSLLWWGASLKILLALGGVGLELPVLPTLPASTPVTFEALKSGVSELDLGAALPASSGTAAVEPRDAAPALSWWVVLFLLWVSGVLAGCCKSLLELLRLAAVLRRAEPVAHPWLAAQEDALARQLGLARPPRLLASSEVAVPQLVGLLRPTILLPAGSLVRVSQAELVMMLAHELAHLSRRDLWLGWVPWLAQRLFFFHPAVALAVREYSLAREAACDALALELLGSAPREYGRMLLHWGVAPRETGLAAAAASPSARTLKRRLEMLAESHDENGRRRRRAWFWAAALLALLLPLQLVSADGRQKSEDSVRVSGTMMSYDSGSERDGWVYVEKVDRNGMSVMMDGGFALRDVKLMALERGTPMLLVRRDGGVYAIEDGELLRQAEAIFGPMIELGERQGELGERQGALGEKQGALGERQGALGERQGELGERLGALGEQLGELGEELAELEPDRGDDGDSDREARRDEIEREMHRIEEKMEALTSEHEGEGGGLAEEQEALGRQQEELGRQQEALGRQQEELGRQQEKLAEAARGQIESLLDRALAAGKAVEVR